MTKEKGAMHKQTIRVVYPTGDAKMVLRTEQNWDANIEPVGQNDCVSKFAIETERPYFYFKPVLLRDNTAQWSRGENFLAVATSGAPLDIHPYFIEDTRCSVCQVMPPLASAAGREHRFRVFLPPGYHENTLKKYPVLYMHDGQNLFLKEEAFLGNTWRTDEVLGVLEGEGKVARIAPDLYYARGAADEAKSLIEAHCRHHGEITAATLRDLLGASRKFAIAFLDWCDRTGVTLRVGDLRKLRKS